MYLMKFDPEIKNQIMTDPKILRFAKKRHYKKRSWDLLVGRFLYFHKATGLLPSEAIDEAGDEEDSGIPMRRSKLVQHLEDLDDFMEDHKYSQNTRQHTMNTVRSFYRRYKITLPEAERLVSEEEKIVLTVQDLPSMDDVKKVLPITNVRDKAIIMIGLSAGLGRAEIVNLELQDFIDAINRKNEDHEITLKTLPELYETKPEWIKKANPLIWYIKRIKTSKHYFTFSSNECFDAILDYLQHYPPVRLRKDTPLFRTLTTDQKISYTRFNHIYNDYNYKCGFGKAKDGRTYFRSHNIRKLCGNQLKKELGYENADKILGHADRNRTRGDYLKADIEELYELYFENMALVTVSQKLIVQTTNKKEIEEIERKHEEDRALDRAEIKQLQIEREKDREEMKRLTDAVKVLQEQKDVNSEIEKLKKE